MASASGYRAARPASATSGSGTEAGSLSGIGIRCGGRSRRDAARSGNRSDWRPSMIVCVRIRVTSGLKPSMSAESRPHESTRPRPGTPSWRYISAYRQRVTSKDSRSSDCSRTRIWYASSFFQSLRASAKVFRSQQPRDRAISMPCCRARFRITARAISMTRRSPNDLAKARSIGSRMRASISRRFSTPTSLSRSGGRSPGCVSSESACYSRWVLVHVFTLVASSRGQAYTARPTATSVPAASCTSTSATARVRPTRIVRPIARRSPRRAGRR